MRCATSCETAARTSSATRSRPGPRTGCRRSRRPCRSSWRQGWSTTTRRSCTRSCPTKCGSRRPRRRRRPPSGRGSSDLPATRQDGRVIRTRRTLADIPRYVPGRSAESVAAEHELARAIKLASNEVPFGPLPTAQEAAAEAMAGANRYPDNDAGALRDALADLYDLEPAQVLVGNGSVQLCQHLFLTTVEPGDEVVFSWPSFEAYPIQAQQADARVRRVPLRDHTYDLDAMGDQVNERTRLVFVCTPN